MKLIDPANLKLQGTFDERLRRSIRHLLEIGTGEMRMEFTQPVEHWHWGADYMGRWIAAMTLLGRYTGEDYQVPIVVKELLGYQQPDGSFGSYGEARDFQEWFGMGRGLIGLLEYHSAVPDPDVLRAAKRLGDYYITHYPDICDCMYECYSSGLEGLVALADLTGEPRYLAIARRMAETSGVYQQIWYSKTLASNGRRSPYSGQVHCTLLTARGLVELHRLTGEEKYLAPVLALHTYIQEEMLWISGGLGFYFYRPDENETCADADWLRLNLLLWQVTDNIEYLELAERILVNQLFFDQADNGGFCYLRGLQNRAGATFDACCSHHGPRALYETMRYTYTIDEDTVQVNLYLEGEARLTIHHQNIRISSHLTQHRDNLEIALKIYDPPPEAFTIQLRVPAWAGSGAIRVNSELPAEQPQSGYGRIHRQWMSGDEIILRLPSPSHFVRSHTVGKHTLYPDEVAAFYGPRLFCLADHLNLDVPIHLVKVLPEAGLSVEGPDRLVAQGVLPDGSDCQLVFSPLSDISGTPSGIGRIYTVRTSYFKTWISTAS